MPKAKPIDVHNIERLYKSSIRRLENASIPEENKETIRKFRAHCVSDGLGKFRVVKYSHFLISISKLLGKDFKDADRADIQRVLEQVEAMPLSFWSKRDYRITLKKFYRWLRDVEVDPPETRWIKVSIKTSSKMLPETLLTEEEILRLIQAAPSDRDKALIALLYETGCRAGELLGLTLASIQFSDPGALVRLNGKTGSRQVRIVFSAPYLSQWLDKHPRKNERDAPMWVCLNSWGPGTPMHYAALRKLLRITAGIAKIKKRVNPHSFRHARATQLSAKWSEAVMKEYLGWTQSSDMAATYVHLSGARMDSAVRELYGLSKPDEQKSKLEPHKCSRCGLINEATNERCSRCTMPLSVNAATQILKAVEEEKAKDKELLKLMWNDIQELKELITEKNRSV